ncbi:cytochrome P450 [Halteromyces radiatus]|uniref:cytochrome P450 n=1 Tax=Halteromyces radiatus TaxID=101107 RepID=UPI002220DC2A|nr:cytochrome P450 [Halteromyces radiatus]KAI8096414.1 cytochrome P450 [Halteromyces radiatus]
MFDSDNKYLKSIGLASSLAAVTLTYLATKYNDRLLFEPARSNIVRKKGLPLVGCTIEVLNGLEQFNHYLLACFEQTGAKTITISSLGLPRGVQTIHPENIEHVLKHNFENYVKGSLFHASTVDLLGHGIFNANGAQWRYQRKAASMIFNVKNFRDHFTDVFVKELVLVRDIFDRAIENKTVVDFHDIMYKFTLDSFVLLGFGTQVNALTTEGKVPFAHSFDELQKNSFDRFMNAMEPVERKFNEIFRPWRTTVAQHQKVIDGFAASVIAKRRTQLAAGEQHKDLLSRFMETDNENGEPLNDKELRDTIMNFIIAGRDTTGQTLSWLLYNLMLHPDVEEKLVQEIVSHVPVELEEDSPALYEAIKDMKYAYAVLYETLRLYPSVPINQKQALKDDVLPDDTPIRAGEVVMWSSYALGRNTDIWGADAKQFRPERWFTESGDIRRESQGKWPAFHAGPRVCLGQNLATLETLVACTVLLRRYKFSMIPNQDITYQNSLTLPMKNGLKVTVAHRG